MRYILNQNGYIEEISDDHIVECNGRTCIEYTGTIPSGYSSLEQWESSANIRAYKIVSGNLTFDSAENTRLENEWSNYDGGRVKVTISGLPSGSSYECYKIPALKMCFATIYLTGAAYSANSNHVIGTVDSDLPSMTTSFAANGLQDYAGVLKSRIAPSGSIYFLTSVAKEDSDDMYLSGFWFTEN